MSQIFPDAHSSEWSLGPFTVLQHKATYSVEINELKGKKARKKFEKGGKVKNDKAYKSLRRPP